MTETVHTAYSVHRRNGSTTYRAVAIVQRDGDTFRHTRRVGIGDSSQEAQEAAVAHVMSTYRDEDMIAPHAIVHHGKRKALLIDTNQF